MPASHDRMTTAVRSASGPPPVSHGRTTSHCSTGDRAKPASHSLRRQLGRPVVGRIAGPYRHCHAVGRTRAGHVHAGRIADGVNSRGAALCASGLAPCGVSWASTRCRIASGARPRRHGDTGPSAATHHQPPSLGRPSPTLLPSAGARPFKLGAGAPVGPARAYHHSGRPSRPAHATRQRRGGASARPPRLTRPLARSPRHAVPASARACHSPAPRQHLNQTPDSPGHWPAHPGTSCLQRHSQATRTRRAHRSQAGRPGPTGDSDAPAGGTGRRAPGDHGQVGTRTLVTTGHRRHVTRWPLMTSHEPCHAIARQLLGATRIHGPDSHRLKSLHR
jgi:hypothetical protein